MPAVFPAERGTLATEPANLGFAADNLGLAHE
jgi:hypothetical protein